MARASLKNCGAELGPMAKIHFIVNPRRPSIGLRWPYEERKVRAFTNDFVTHITRGRSHAELLTRDAIAQGAKLIVCVGGDSTLCEIVNELDRASRGGFEVPALTLHPALQKGDAVKSIALRDNFSDFILSFLEDRATEQLLDLGEVEFTGDYGQKIRRLFLNAAGFGFSSTLVSKMSQDPYASRSNWGFLRLLFRLAPFYRHPEITLVIDGQKILSKKNILTGLVHNGRYGGRGLHLSPDATFGDGQLEYTVILKTLAFRYLWIALQILYSELKTSKYVLRGKFKEMIVTPTRPHRRIQVDFDGDVWGYLPAKFKIMEKYLRFLS